MIRLMLIFVIAFTTVNALHAELQWQTHESVYETVKAYVANNINTTAEYEINIVPLNDRLHLPLCGQPIQVVASNLLKTGRSSINVHCGVGKTWAIFVSVSITPFDNVAVLTQSIRLGETITSRHVAIVRKDVSKLHDNYLTQLDPIIDKQMVRDLAAGSIITTKDFVEPKLVKRGDRVMISAAKSGIGIKMNGIAQSDGSRGQVIHVKNQNSERVISAVITDVGQVSVLP